jgi:hypothetical protein
MAKLDELESRKALLVAQAEFDRLKLGMALHDVRRIVRPTVTSAERSAVHSLTARVLRVALPVLGFSRVGRVVRGLSIALSVYRFLHGWRPRR